MVRINIIHPKKLSDQHLIAEHNEILMLLGNVKKNLNFDVKDIPKTYRLGQGHINFFKNKLKYLEKRHKLIQIEMHKRNFKTNKYFDLQGIKIDFINDWKPNKNDFEIIKERIRYKINLKPKFYRYYGEYKGREFLVNLLD